MAVKPMPPFEELMLRSLRHAEQAEELVSAPSFDEGHAAAGQIHATLAEAYARLASAMVVNRTSLHAALDAPRGGGRVS